MECAMQVINHAPILLSSGNDQRKETVKFKIIAFVLLAFGCGQHGLAHFKTSANSPIQIKL